MRTLLAEGSSEGGLFNGTHKEDSKFVSSSIGSEISFGSWTSESLGSQSLSWEEVGTFSKQQLKRRLSHISDEHTHHKEGKTSKYDEDEKDGLAESTENQVSRQVNLLLEEDEKKKPSLNNYITEECIFELELDMEDKVTRPPQQRQEEVQDDDDDDEETAYASSLAARLSHSTSSASSVFLRTRSFEEEKEETVDDGYPNISSKVRQINTPQLLSFSQPTYQYSLSSWGNSNNSAIQSSPSKKSLCKFFAQGSCKAGLECRYSHDIAVSPQQQQPLSPPLGAQAAFSPMSSNTILGSSPNLLPLNTGTLNRERRNSSSKFCKFYVQGYCRYGESCPFLHQEHDILESPPVYATPHSPHVQSSPLFSGDFDHQPNLSPPSPTMNSLSSSLNNNYGEQKQVCNFFAKGECKFGDKCRNLHQVPMKKKLITEESIRKFSTIPCKYFTTQGFCPWGTACYYNHSMMSPQQPQATTFLSHMASRRQNM